MRHRPIALLAALALPLALLPWQPAGAQGTGQGTPQGPMVIVTGFGAPSAADISARLLAAEFTTLLGRPVAVKSTSGAAGTIATNEVVRARPDGATLLFSPVGPMAIQPSFMRNAGYRTNDLEPICQVNQAALVMMTPANSGLRTLADVLARARAERGAMPYATTGMGTTPHLSMVQLARAAGIELTHITYRGPGDVMVAFQQGSVALMNDHPSSVRANGLHPIAVLAAERLPDFPEAPTLRELGHDIVLSIWHGLFAPKGTPAALLERVEAACAAAVQSPAVRAGHERIQTPIVYRNRRDFGEFVTAEAERFRGIIEANNLRQTE